MTTQPNFKSAIAEELLEFESEEFLDSAGRPHCQWFNDQHYGGLLLKEDYVEAVDFDAETALEHGYQWINWSFGNEDQEAESVNCLVTANPILSVLKAGTLKMYDRKTGALIGPYESRAYKRDQHVCKTRYLIYHLVQVDGEYGLLHAEPLQLTLKGSIGAAFGKKGGPLNLIEQAVGKHYGRKVPPFAFCMNLTITPEERTDEQSNESYWLSVLEEATPIISREALDQLYVGKQNLAVMNSAYQQNKDFE